MASETRGSRRATRQPEAGVPKSRSNRQRCPPATPSVSHQMLGQRHVKQRPICVVGPVCAALGIGAGGLLDYDHLRDRVDPDVLAVNADRAYGLVLVIERPPLVVVRVGGLAEPLDTRKLAVKLLV